ncbi:5-formyltetrahydrofolate cyclo-ligase [Pedobacter gandavensis]|uniref:5-formyltetrahydrofolate cyclo-ligase n=1 Tax=Pedobacter gandavensis TaxID=2679963 RepID=UPI002478BA90|nr:5-formyltetrahydrofolate cyclo-ligase [Pedobacter gandavensis]WGQ07800.1 5-formyltetrahydrofolate cyclo-ligase [Pedobacter gandavensis]
MESAIRNMDKASIRKQILPIRKALSPEEVQELTEKLLEQFKLLDLSKVKTLHIFLPIKSQNEPDTFLIINWLKVHHPEIKIVVPRADFETSLMTPHYFEGMDDLEMNAYQILEPAKAKIHEGEIQMVIVPLIAFDRNGYRVGYGKGFYDRFLQGIRTEKIGLSLLDELVEIDNVNAHDVQLDRCITPNQTYVFPIS